jgi:hypothetical protein
MVIWPFSVFVIFPEIVIGSFEVVNEAKTKIARDRYFFHGLFFNVNQI